MLYGYWLFRQFPVFLNNLNLNKSYTLFTGESLKYAFIAQYAQLQ